MSASPFTVKQKNVGIMKWKKIYMHRNYEDKKNIINYERKELFAATMEVEKIIRPAPR